MSSIIISSDLEDFPGYEIRYNPEWESGGRIWSKKKEIYIKVKKDKKGYWRACINKLGKMNHFLLHRLLIEYFKPEIWQADLVVNHINHNRSDNRLENLEMISGERNASDRDRTNLSSIYQGVHYRKGAQKWAACARVHKGDSDHLGLFDLEIEAARCRDKFIIEHKLDRVLNFKPE